MAMSFPSDPVASPQQQGNVNTDDNNNSDSSSSSASPTSSNDRLGMIPSNDQIISHAQAIPAFGPKRKPTRRANTAERRATHNAVERQRRETLNGRFLDLANLLPNLSQIRRPSKSSIVNSSIAHIQASRRHRMIASRELRVLKHESDALRRELNEWRDRTGLPRVEEPTRGDGFAMVLTGELEAISGVSIEEEDEDVDEGLGLGFAMSGLPNQHQPTQQHQQQLASYGGGGAYMDEGDDDVHAPYQHQQQQQTAAIVPQIRHAVHHAPQHQQQQQNTMMADLEDPHMAPMMKKNAAVSNPFAHDSPCYPTINTRSLYPTTTWAPGGSPSSTSSSLSGGGGGSPISFVPSPLANCRNGCISPGGHNCGDQSPPYEYRSAQSEYGGGSRSTGMLSPPYFVPSQHHQLHGGPTFPQAIGVGGGFHGSLMMTI